MTEEIGRRKNTYRSPGSDDGGAGAFAAAGAEAGAGAGAGAAFGFAASFFFSFFGAEIGEEEESKGGEEYQEQDRERNVKAKRTYFA